MAPKPRLPPHQTVWERIRNGLNLRKVLAVLPVYHGSSPQLTVLASPAVDRCVNHRLIAFGLTAHAGTRARQRLPAPLWDAVTTIFALVAALTDRQAGACGKDCIRDGVFDLILHSAVARPTTGHVEFLERYANIIW